MKKHILLITISILSLNLFAQDFNIVKDISPGLAKTTITEMITINNMIYFIADDNQHGFELWASDGTESGTYMVKDIFPGIDNFQFANSSFPLYLTNFNNTLFFYANDSIHGYELWKSDGTEAGTVMVKDIYQGKENSLIEGFTLCNNTLFFKADDGVNGLELWKTDGTEQGTVMMKDIASGIFGANPNYLKCWNNNLYFSAYTEALGEELWISDGTTAGTNLFADITPGEQSSLPAHLTPVNSRLYLIAECDFWVLEEGSSMPVKLLLSPG